jgi:predicted ester cyclase
MITRKRSTSKSPFELVYGLNIVFPINMKLPTYKLLGQFSTNNEALQNRIDELVQLEEDRLMAYTQFTDYQTQIKKVFDRKEKGKQFQIGGMVLWDKKNEKSSDHGKFDNLWLGPYRIDSAVGPNTFQLADLEGDLMGLPVYGQRLKYFFQ